MLLNKLKWISGRRAGAESLEQLNQRMSEYYSRMSSRQAYQELNDETHASEGDPVNRLTDLIVEQVIKNDYKNVLEIGCGSGKVYQRLLEKGFKGNYSGIEMAEAVIQSNRTSFPGATWEAASVYDYCEKVSGFDCCFSLFVLEHLIYPEEALKKMLATLKPGGHLLLVFPDFSKLGILPSQKVGITYGQGAKIKFREGKLADAVISFLESRIVRNKLKNVNDRYGAFVINTNPFCLSKDYILLAPDADAVYLANKNEVENWAKGLGYEVKYPYGKEDLFSYNAFIDIKNRE